MHHPWRLVAPWYRWDLRDAPSPARAAMAGRPAIQKYTSDSFVDDFMADPQASAAYTPVDEVQRIESIAALPQITSGPNAFKTRQLARNRAVPSGVRKLFQPAHQRFYVVTIELHCDMPGFPSVDAAQIGEVGFVVRRRVTSIPSGRERELATRLAEMAQKRAKGNAEARLDAARIRAKALVPLRSASRARVIEPRAATTAAFHEVAVAKRHLAEWAIDAGVTSDVQGWVAEKGSIGAWVPVADRPDEVVEVVYPMFRAAPAAADPDHAGRFGTIYFGVIPACSDEASEDGGPRFDDVNAYEIRCFARRANTPCPPPPVWSEASATFRLASFFDPAGCANRPVNVRMPSFAELEASVAKPSMRVSTPPGSHLMYATSAVPPTSGSVGTTDEICFFAIPLIMIVAFFLLNLFLPIILLLFSLWFMLKLKFCIPPSVQLGADLDAELSVIPGGVEFAAGIDIDILPGVNQATLQTKLKSGLNGVSPGLGDQLTAKLTNNAIVQALIVQGIGTDGAQSYPSSHPIEPRVRRDEVVHP